MDTLFSQVSLTGDRHKILSLYWTQFSDENQSKLT